MFQLRIKGHVLKRKEGRGVFNKVEIWERTVRLRYLIKREDRAPEHVDNSVTSPATPLGQFQSSDVRDVDEGEKSLEGPLLSIF